MTRLASDLSYAFHAQAGLWAAATNNLSRAFVPNPKRTTKVLGVNMPLSDLARLLPTQQPSGFDDFARSPSSNPEEMNAHVSSNRLRDEQSIRRKDERDSPRTRGLRMHVIWAND